MENLNVRSWLHGLAATMINGVASGVVLIIAEPEHFNIWDGREKLITVSLLMGLIAAANYLKESPLPKSWR